MILEHRPITKLLPYAGNVMNHGKDQISSLVSGILEFGFNNPVLISEDGTIIAGHCRVLAASQIGMEKVPCIVLAHLDEAKRRAYAIADNKIARKSTFNLERLSAELDELARLEINIENLGFDSLELDSLLATVQGFLPDEDVTPRSNSLAINEPASSTSAQSSELGKSRKEPKQVDGELEQIHQPNKKPKGQNYDRFEIVMSEQNKQKLTDLLSSILENHGFENLEDAIMHLVDSYE